MPPNVFFVSFCRSLLTSLPHTHTPPPSSSSHLDRTHSLPQFLSSHSPHMFLPSSSPSSPHPSLSFSFSFKPLRRRRRRRRRRTPFAQKRDSIYLFFRHKIDHFNYVRGKKSHRVEKKTRYPLPHPPTHLPRFHQYLHLNFPHPSSLPPPPFACVAREVRSLLHLLCSAHTHTHTHKHTNPLPQNSLSPSYPPPPPIPPLPNCAILSTCGVFLLQLTIIFYVSSNDRLCLPLPSPSPPPPCLLPCQYECPSLSLSLSLSAAPSELAGPIAQYKFGGERTTTPPPPRFVVFFLLKFFLYSGAEENMAVSHLFFPNVFEGGIVLKE